MQVHRLTSQKPIFLKTAIRASNPSVAAKSSSLGLYSAKQYELPVPNVDLVLEDIRPYLIAHGGNVDVVSVEDNIVSLKLEVGENGFKLGFSNVLAKENKKRTLMVVTMEICLKAGVKVKIDNPCVTFSPIYKSRGQSENQ